MVLTDDDELAESLRSLRNLGFTQPRFWHPTAAYNFRMTGMQAALGVAQLRKIESMNQKRRNMAQLYKKHLGDPCDRRLCRRWC